MADGDFGKARNARGEHRQVGDGEVVAGIDAKAEPEGDIRRLAEPSGKARGLSRVVVAAAIGAV